MNEVEFYRALFELEQKGLVEIDDESESVRLTSAGREAFTVYKDIPDPSYQGEILKLVGEERNDSDSEQASDWMHDM